MPPFIHSYSDEINYLVWRYLRESNLSQTAWTLEAEIKSKTGKDVVSIHEQLGKTTPFDLPKRLRMSMQYQEVLKHMSEDGDLPCTAPFTLLSEHTCNKGEDTRIPIPEVIERPWQLEPGSFPHGEPLPLSTAIQQPRTTRRLAREENALNNSNNGGLILPATKGRPPNSKRRKPNHQNNLPPNTLATGIVEEEGESNVDEEMDEDTVVMNGEDVVMKDSVTSAKSENEPIYVIPDEKPVQFGEVNTIIAAWSEKSLLATGQDGMVKTWTIHPRGENRVDQHHIDLPTNAPGEVTSISWHPNDTFLAAGTFEGLTTIWNIDGSLRASSPSSYGPIFALRFNPSGTLLVTCSANGAFEVYDTTEWTSIFKVPASSSKIWEVQPVLPCLTWLDDSRLAILGPEPPGATVNCWQFDESHATHPFIRLFGHEGLVNDVQYDKVSGLVATASDDQTVRLWKVDKPTPFHEFRNHTDAVKLVAFQPVPPSMAESDSPRILASASFDGTVSIYNVTTLSHLYTIGKEIHNFPGDRISCLSWSPDGKYLSTGDLEGTVGIWEWRDSAEPRAFAIWAPERIREDQSDAIPNGTNGHKDDLDRPVLRIHWQKNGQSFIVCRQNRKVALVDWPLER